MGHISLVPLDEHVLARQTKPLVLCCFTTHFAASAFAVTVTVVDLVAVDEDEEEDDEDEEEELELDVDASSSVLRTR
jgi:hypothetical protein